ncbi:MAG: lmo0937 family membrane protein [Wenzhouxiangella sp.]
MELESLEMARCHIVHHVGALVSGLEGQAHDRRRLDGALQVCGSKQTTALETGMMKQESSAISVASTLNKGTLTMLFTIAIILLALWALGLISGTTVGGFVHVLLVIAIVVILIQLLSGRRVV